MQVELLFKTSRQEKEFEELDIRVKALALYVAFYFKRSFNVAPVVTSVLRTAEEQDRLFAAKLTTIKQSPHMFGRAIDIRLKDVRTETIPLLVVMLNKNFHRSDGKPTALAHGVGDNYHLHLQVPAI